MGILLIPGVLQDAEAQSVATSPYFINCDSSAFFNSGAASIDIDSSGNIYFVSGGGGIGKIDSSCNVQWKINVDTAPIDSVRGVSIRSCWRARRARVVR